MISRDYRTYGWWYTVLGGVLFVAAVAMLFDPSSTRIKIGALIVAPILFGRGVYLLRLYFADPDVRNPPPPLPGDPVGLYRELIRQGSSVKAVTCAGCGHEYVYLPGRAAQFQAESLGRDVAMEMAAQAIVADRALAPCPRCGLVPPEMFAACPSPASALMWAYLGIFASFAAVLAFAYALSTSLDSTPNRAPPTARPWVVCGMLFLVGVGSFGLAWFLQKRWNPNSRPQTERLQLGKQVSLSRDEYEKLRRDGV